jgi:quercetin dioxygenase-like cupin family protein
VKPSGAAAVGVLAAAALSACGGSGGSGKTDTGAKGGAPKRTALAQTVDPKGAAGETLGLARVVLPPGAKLPLHYHDGTQVAYVDKGVLTYTVVRGDVAVMRGAPGEHPTVVRRIGPGQAARIGEGEWLVEDRADVHRGENRGDGKVVVLLASLLRDGAPPATPVAQAGK